MAPTAYVYSPLPDKDSIRLLHVQRCEPASPPSHEAAPSAPEEGLAGWEFSIVEETLGENPYPFEAVSYVWGSREKCFDLPIGQDHTLAITESVSLALPRLLAASKTEYLWIDQICINQDDVLEKNDQVRFMGNIYKKADSVLAWLGEMDEEDSAHLLELMNGVKEEKKSCTGSSLENVAYPKIVAMIQGNPEYLNALQALLDRPWFTRAWIFQEAILCQTLILLVGNIAIPNLGLLFTVLRSISFSRPKTDKEYVSLFVMSGYNGAWNLCKMKERNHVRHTDWKWYHLLYAMSEKKVSDPRDHIFAFLGFLVESDIIIEPDYSISAEETFLRCARAIIEGGRSLDVLDTTRRKKRFRAGEGWLPSWVPDWSKGAESSPLFEISNAPSRPRSLFKASLDRIHNPSSAHTLIRRQLHIRGKRISDIALVTQRSAATIQASTLERLQARFPIDDLAKQLHGVMRPGQVRERLGRVIAVDGGGSESMVRKGYHPLSPELLSKILEIHDRLMNPDGTSGEEFQTQARHFLQNYRALFLSATGRRVFCTSDGKLGLGPKESRNGDHIVIAHGSRIPLVLRPARTIGKFWLIGTCYVEDIMYGDACTWDEDEADELILV